MTTLHIFSNRHIKNEVQNIKKDDWIYLENGMSKGRWSLYFRVNNINEEKLNITYITEQELLNGEVNMKFDVIVGNPPYDKDSEGGQGKIYNLISKVAIKLRKPGGVIHFITPLPPLRKSKRFSLVGQEGLKSVDFTIDEEFNVGTTVCHWEIDDLYRGDVSVKLSDKSEVIYKEGENIYDAEQGDESTAIYNSVIEKTAEQKNKNLRMFKRYTHAGAFSKIENKEYQYPLVTNNRGTESIVYGKTQPKDVGLKKIYVSNTKALNEDTVFVDTRTYGPSFFYIVINNENDIENIKSFVLSDYFKDLYKSFREIRGGMNSTIIDYCPIFDFSKSWTNDEVKEFFKSC